MRDQVFQYNSLQILVREGNIMEGPEQKRQATGALGKIVNEGKSVYECGTHHFFGVLVPSEEPYARDGHTRNVSRIPCPYIIFNHATLHLPSLPLHAVPVFSHPERALHLSFITFPAVLYIFFGSIFLHSMDMFTPSQGSPCSCCNSTIHSWSLHFHSHNLKHFPISKSFYIFLHLTPS